MRAIIPVIFSATLFLAACAPQEKPKPEIIRVPVDRVIQEKCKDARPADFDYPDTPEKLAQIPADDYETLGKVKADTITKLRARIVQDDIQIKACAGQ